MFRPTVSVLLPVAPNFKSGNASLCIWGMFSSHGRSQFVRISGSLDQFKYIDILKKCVLPFKNTFYSGNTGFMYQHDGCGLHCVKRVAAFLDANGVNLLWWSAPSPNLNSIEKVWSIMKRRLRMLPKYPTTADKLFELLLWF